MFYFPYLQSAYFEFIQPCKPLAVFTASQPLTAWVWVNVSPSCKMISTGQSVPPQLLKLTLPASKPVLTWHISGAGVRVAGFVCLPTWATAAAFWAVNEQAMTSKGKRVKSILDLCISLHWVEYPRA